MKAFEPNPFDRPSYFAAAPTRDQAKRIYWNDLKRLVPRKFMAKNPSETELTIYIVNGAEISVIGMDKPERIEGSPRDGGILDEFANMKAKVWGENVRPALSDRLGWCDLLGVPEGRNHYYDLNQFALNQMLEHGNKSEWGTFTWKSADILPDSEIESAKLSLDELTFKQEYEASFVNFQGLVYYPFDRNTHCARLEYNPKAPLILMFDFNVSPAVACMAQEMDLPNGNYGTGVIGEVWIPKNSNTVHVSNKIITDWCNHEGEVMIYGDATGGASGSAKIAGSDWDLVQATLKPIFKDRLTMMVGRSNPRERVRVNAVNARLKTISGDVYTMIDPTKAPHLVSDFEGVCMLEGGSGEIDKKKTPELTHISDSFGYYVAKEFPIAGHGVIIKDY